MNNTLSSMLSFNWEIFILLKLKSGNIYIFYWLANADFRKAKGLPNISGHGDRFLMNNLRCDKLWRAKQTVLVSGCVYFLAEAKVADLDLISWRIHHQNIIRLNREENIKRRVKNYRETNVTINI